MIDLSHWLVYVSSWYDCLRDDLYSQIRDKPNKFVDYMTRYFASGSYLEPTISTDLVDEAYSIYQIWIISCLNQFTLINTLISGCRKLFSCRILFPQSELILVPSLTSINLTLMRKSFTSLLFPRQSMTSVFILVTAPHRTIRCYL